MKLCFVRRSLEVQFLLCTATKAVPWLIALFGTLERRHAPLCVYSVLNYDYSPLVAIKLPSPQSEARKRLSIPSPSNMSWLLICRNGMCLILIQGFPLHTNYRRGLYSQPFVAFAHHRRRASSQRGREWQRSMHIGPRLNIATKLYCPRFIL